MAQSPTHRFGQIIGAILEDAIHPPLEKVARKHKLYLDWKHSRKARGNKKKVTWVDHLGNEHDLDYVLEQGGSEDETGHPRAFIEIAYRRYTKHSRNKAGEIQCAVAPLAEKYRSYHPFLGVVLAGVFTEGSLTQLRTNGFGVLYFPFESIVKAFARVGIDAFFDERSLDAVVNEKVNAFDRLSEEQKASIPTALRRLHRTDLSQFMHQLETSLTRTIESVFVRALHGKSCQANSAIKAIGFIEDYDESISAVGFVRYEINVRYTNGDEIRGSFRTKSDAISFLRKQA